MTDEITWFLQLELYFERYPCFILVIITISPFFQLLFQQKKQNIHSDCMLLSCRVHVSE